jgi:hypothetical protein
MERALMEHSVFDFFDIFVREGFFSVRARERPVGFRGWSYP